MERLADPAATEGRVLTLPVELVLRRSTAAPA
ncbi:hypothetical protein ACFSHQ_00585 [Gemmobacter lanyuensis]